MDIINLRKKINSFFKISGINLPGDDCQFLAEKMSSLPLRNKEQDNWLNEIIDNLQSQHIKHKLDRQALEAAIKNLQNSNAAEEEPIFSVINAFEVPRFNYNRSKKMFESDNSVRQIITDVGMKSMHLRQRYLMLLQKAQRHELFAPKIIENGVSQEVSGKKFKLVYVEDLLSSSELSETVVLGYLTHPKREKYRLADLTGYVELNLENARFHAGFFCEGSFVLVEGNYKDKVLNVHGVGFPPAKSDETIPSFLGEPNTWGGKSEKLLKNSTTLAEKEYRNKEATLVFLSDVRLDAPHVKDKLRKLFLAYDDYPPVAIILMGPFAPSATDIYDMSRLLRELGELADNCNELKMSTDLVLIPANDDPVALNVLPRHPLPKSIAADLIKLWPRTILATNPCRLQYCTQQISVCRLDLMAKFCRNTIHFPNDDTPIEHHLARTLICQGHLTPFTARVAPVHWDFDSAMWLFPLPDLVVLGDSCRDFQTLHHDCIIANTGSFSRSKGVFKVYNPTTRTLEDSQIPDDMDTELNDNNPEEENN